MTHSASSRCILRGTPFWGLTGRLFLPPNYGPFWRLNYSANPNLTRRATASMVWNGFIVSPETAVEGIETVWPGQFYVFDSSGSEEHAEDYWSMPHNKPVSAIDELYLANTLEQSVRLHLASDVPLGIFLSSGVDLATVANVALKTSQSPVHTFTLAFEEQEYNEATMARRIAAAIGTQHQELMLTEQRFIAQLDAALGSLDQPSFDGLNTYYMSQAVRDAGFKVALVGTGGDELFGGYASFRDLPTLLRFLTFAKWLPRSVTAQLATLVSRRATIILRKRPTADSMGKTSGYG